MDYFTALVISNDEEALKDYLLYKMMRKELVEKQCLYNSASFDIKNVPEKNCIYLFRFDKEHIYKLHKALQMPFRFETSDLHVIGGRYV